MNAPDAAGAAEPEESVVTAKRSPLARIAGALPPGTLLVITGTVVLGAASYIHLMAAGHSLDTDGMAALSVLWTILMSVGIGLFFPVEQELTRIVAAHRVAGTGVSGILRQIAGLTLGMIVLLGAGLAWAAPLLADTFFYGHTEMVGALGLAFAAMALSNICRGVLAGLGRFGPFGWQLGIDGGLRIGLAVGFALAGVRSPLAFALILTAAPLIAALVTSVPVFRGLAAGPSDRWSGLIGGLGPLVLSTLLSQVVVNAAVVSTKLLAPEDGALVAGLLNAIVLARVPLFVFGSLQASLLSGLSTAAAAGDRAGFSRLLGRTSLVVIVLGLAGGLPATLLGPWLIEVLFKSEAGLGHAVFFWISAGTLCYMLAMVLGQALLVLHKHRLQLLGWAVATLVLVGATLLPGEVSTRVCVAYTLASFAAVLGMAAAVWATFLRRPQAAAPAVAAPGEAAAPALADRS
ncbi:lipopolysaccharide biosynthesis protein [Streptomyces sp. NPDC002104]